VAYKVSFDTPVRIFKIEKIFFSPELTLQQENFTYSPFCSTAVLVVSGGFLHLKSLGSWTHTRVILGTLRTHVFVVDAV
jgi:hypothetical protein